MTLLFGVALLSEPATVRYIDTKTFWGSRGRMAARGTGLCGDRTVVALNGDWADAGNAERHCHDRRDGGA